MSKRERLLWLAVVSLSLAARSRHSSSRKEIKGHDPQHQCPYHQESSHAEAVNIPRDADYRAESGKQHAEETAVSRRLDWVALFTLLLVVVGGLQVWVYVITERAYLSLNAIGMDGPLVVDKAIVLRFQIKNSGRTTADVTDANLTIDVLATNEHLPSRPPYVAGASISAVLGPIVAGDTFFGTSRPQTKDMHPYSWVAPWAAEKRTMYVFGYIKYDDGFSLFRLGSPRITGFCARYDPDENPATGTFVTCNEPNYRYGD